LEKRKRPHNMKPLKAHTVQLEKPVSSANP
jgi:hypothetical protein